jgi:hypothetical protein
VGAWDTADGFQQPIAPRFKIERCGICSKRSRDSSVGIATGYGFDFRDSEKKILFTASRRALMLNESPIQTSTRAKTAGVWRWPRSPPSSVEVKNGTAIPPLPNVFMAKKVYKVVPVLN